MQGLRLPCKHAALEPPILLPPTPDSRMLAQALSPCAGRCINRTPAGRRTGAKEYAVGSSSKRRRSGTPGRSGAASACANVWNGAPGRHAAPRASPAGGRSARLLARRQPSVTYLGALAARCQRRQLLGAGHAVQTGVLARGSADQAREGLAEEPLCHQQGAPTGRSQVAQKRSAADQHGTGYSPRLAARRVHVLEVRKYVGIRVAGGDPEVHQRRARDLQARWQRRPGERGVPARAQVRVAQRLHRLQHDLIARRALRSRTRRQLGDTHRMSGFYFEKAHRAGPAD